MVKELIKMAGKKINPDQAFTPPIKEVWGGRETDPALGIQYWYQAIDLLNAEDIISSEEKINVPNVSILGYACDEGVRRNEGRVGAINGPLKVRERLARIAYHIQNKTVGDLGDVNCVGEDLEACQRNLATLVSNLVMNSSLPIVIGGGHDIAFGHFQGLFDAKQEKAGHRFGIINFDAHFDLRPVDDKPNSGTPFNQILTEYGDQVEYFVIGIQPSGNTKELYNIAAKNDVQFIESTECNMSKVPEMFSKLDTMISKVDSLYISIDMDGFSSAYAPGVSAPSPFGFEPAFVLAVLDHIIASKKVISVDFAELNPKYDHDNLTANLVARLIDYIVRKI